MEPKVYRQGDVLLVRVEAVPDDGALQRCSKVRVAEGEATGHAHVLEPATDETTIEVVLDDTDVAFLRIMGANGLLVHEEHTAIEVEPGDYRVVRQYEHEPERARMVAD